LWTFLLYFIPVLVCFGKTNLASLVYITGFQFLGAFNDAWQDGSSSSENNNKKGFIHPRGLEAWTPSRCSMEHSKTIPLRYGPCNCNCNCMHRQRVPINIFNADLYSTQTDFTTSAWAQKTQKNRPIFKTRFLPPSLFLQKSSFIPKPLKVTRD
jgi:hypothetical protein